MTKTFQTLAQTGLKEQQQQRLLLRQLWAKIDLLPKRLITWPELPDLHNEVHQTATLIPSALFPQFAGMGITSFPITTDTPQAAEWVFYPIPKEHQPKGITSLMLLNDLPAVTIRHLVKMIREDAASYMGFMHEGLHFFQQQKTPYSKSPNFERDEQGQPKLSVKNQNLYYKHGPEKIVFLNEGLEKLEQANLPWQADFEAWFKAAQGYFEDSFLFSIGHSPNEMRWFRRKMWDYWRMTKP